MILLITTMIMPAHYFISWVMINDRPMGSCFPRAVVRGAEESLE